MDKWYAALNCVQIAHIASFLAPGLSKGISRH